MANEIISGKDIWAGDIPDGPMSWRPIKTAPKDGTFILVGSAEMGVFKASWVEWNEGMWHPEFAECPYLEEEGDVTHWMPLPDPPQ